jgi:4-amino-4-deoxy-L-arabinose transferase-like glycosyltransferase
MNRLLKRLPWVLFFACATLFYLPLGGRALWNSDEGRYAEIARELLELKDWLTPHLNYVVYFEKPPLMYWLTAASLLVFGQNEFAARFWCATFGLLTVGVTYLIGRDWKGERTGLLAGAILATSLLFFSLTQFLVLDMALTFWLMLALYAGNHILLERSPERVSKYTDLLAVAVAGGILTKGLVAAVLPIAVLGLTLFYSGLQGQARKISWRPALVLLMVIVAPWFVAVSMKHPFFPEFFFIREHLSRYLTPIHHRTAPYYFYLPVLVGGLLPWSVFLPRVIHQWLKHRGVAMKRDPVGAHLILWSAFVFLFFSASQSKLVAYILPVLPSLALLVGFEFDQALEEPLTPAWIRRSLEILIGLFVAFLLTLKWAHGNPSLKDPLVASVCQLDGLLALVLALGVLVFVGVRGMRQTLFCFGGILVVQVLLLSIVASMAPCLDSYLSNRLMAQTLTSRAAPEDRVVGYGVSYDNVLQSLPFYSHRRIAVFGDPGELDLGRVHTADAADWFVLEGEAPAALKSMPVGTWVVTDAEHHKILSQTGVSAALELVSRDGRLLLFRKAR